MGKSALSFLTNYFGQMDFTMAASDRELLELIQTGTGGFSTGNGNIIEITPIFGGT
jgi:hypothetical protein